MRAKGAIGMNEGFPDMFDPILDQGDPEDHPPDSTLQSQALRNEGRQERLRKDCLPAAEVRPDAA